MRALIFDLDGTLFQTEKVAVPAFQETIQILQAEGWGGMTPTAQQIQSVFGMTHEEIWHHLLPHADHDIKHRADHLLVEKELSLLANGHGELFPEVEETLERLKRQGWALFIASNGGGVYVRGALDSKGLTPLFQGIYAAGEHRTKTKVELVRLCKEEHGITEGYMIGDRSSDVEAGKANGLTVIGCRYVGFPQFGTQDELVAADYTIDSFGQIEQIVG